MTHLIKKKKKENEKQKQALKGAGLWRYYGLENAIPRFRKCRVIVFKTDMSWRSILTLKLRLDAVPSYGHEGVHLQPGDPAG